MECVTTFRCICLLCTTAKTFKPTHAQDIGGPHAGDDNDEVYVLDLDDFIGLDRNFATKIVSRITAPCATNVRIEAVIAGFGRAPSDIKCSGRGETCGEADDGEIIDLPHLGLNYCLDGAKLLGVVSVRYMFL